MNIIRQLKLKGRHRHLLMLVKDSRLKLGIAMGFMLLSSGATSAAAYLIKHVLDDVFIARDAAMLNIIPLAFLALYALKSLSMFMSVYLMSYVGQNIVRKLRNLLYDRIQDMPISFFQQQKTGVLMARVTNDVGIIRGMVSTMVTGSIRDISQIIGLVCVIFFQIWGLALIAFLVIPVAFYPMIVFGRRVRRTSLGSQETVADINVLLHETFAGNKIVKAFGMEAFEKSRFYQKTRQLFKLEVKEAKYRSLSSPINQLLGGLAVAFIIWYGGSNVIDGTYTAGTFMSFITAVLLLYEPVKKLSKFNNELQRGLAATDRVFDIIEREPEINERPNPVVLNATPCRVTFQNVSFKYDDQTVLQDINLDVKQGEVLALVGMSGGGKSTLVNLIPRFYDVWKGAVLIDGQDIREYSIASLRSQIAIVTQEPILFNDTVRNNIAYGRRDASDQEIADAARAAYAFDFIQQFPQQFDTNIGELGGRLSGGEKQRLCIARALLKDSPILILDEATSSLDSEAEKVVQKALENLMRGRTTFVIAHRLSTVEYAHRIAVMVKGRIVEEGSHEELLALNGEYSKLYRMQFSNNAAVVEPLPSDPTKP